MIIRTSGDNNALTITNENNEIILDIKIDRIEVTMDVLLFVQNIASVETGIKAHVAKLLEKSQPPNPSWYPQE